MPFNQGIESDASPHVGVIALKKTARQMMCTSLRQRCIMAMSDFHSSC